MLLPRNRVKLEEFLPHVMAMVQGDSRPALPSAAALSYIRNSTINFARRSSVLVRKERIKFQPDNCLYPLVDAPEEEQPYRIQRVYHDNSNLCSDGSWNIPASIRDDVLRIRESALPGDPCEDQYFIVEFVVIPTRKCCEVDEILFNEWHDAIIDGALEKIHLMPQRPWTSGTASRECQRNFLVAVAEARRKFFTDRAGTVIPTVPLPSNVRRR